MADLGAGSELDGYRLESLLGSGGFGSVWRATELDSGETVALKLLTGSYSQGDVARLRADVELLAASASSSSPHVVRVLGGSADLTPYVIMEFVDGEDLATRLQRLGRLSVSETIGVGRAVANALRALRDAEIIHRDVKPANVMIDSHGTVKLADFGIAKIVGFETITVTGQMPMSIAYSAPEVWDGRPSHQSDLYALGILLYQCLTGVPPFVGTHAEVYGKHLNEQPAIAALTDETPRALVELISLCLEKEPKRRPADASACLQLLDEALAELERPEGDPQSAMPTRLGRYEVVSPHPSRPATYLCVATETNERATVELHFSDDIAYGERLRAAVEVNPRLVELGAERVVGESRLVLRPGEAFEQTPSRAVRVLGRPRRADGRAGSPPDGRRPVADGNDAGPPARSD